LKADLAQSTQSYAKLNQNKKKGNGSWKGGG